jgi:hypothetical protein
MALSFIFLSEDAEHGFVQIDLHFAPSAIFSNVAKKSSFIPIHQDGYLFKGKDDGPVYQFGMIKQMLDHFELTVNRDSQLLVVLHDFELKCDPVSDLTMRLIDLELEELGLGPCLKISAELISKFKRNKQPCWKK